MKYNTKVSSLYVAQVKAKHGLEMLDCYDRPRSENSRQPEMPKEKEKMIEPGSCSKCQYPEPEKEFYAS